MDCAWLQGTRPIAAVAGTTPQTAAAPALPPHSVARYRPSHFPATRLIPVTGARRGPAPARWRATHPRPARVCRRLSCSNPWSITVPGFFQCSGQGIPESYPSLDGNRQHRDWGTQAGFLRLTKAAGVSAQRGAYAPDADVAYATEKWPRPRMI